MPTPSSFPEEHRGRVTEERRDYSRIVIIGSTGSGKSTLAEQLSQRLGLEFIELDALSWMPGWVQRPTEDFRALVQQQVISERWVMAGNYSSVRDISWSRAQAVIWLDYPFWTIFRQLFRRTLKRWWTQELLWGTNRETLWQQLKLWSPQDSLFSWLIVTYSRRRREYPILFQQPEYRHLHLIHLHTPQETRVWLESLPHQ